MPPQWPDSSPTQRLSRKRRQLWAYPSEQSHRYCRDGEKRHEKQINQRSGKILQESFEGWAHVFSINWWGLGMLRCSWLRLPAATGQRDESMGRRVNTYE